MRYLIEEAQEAGDVQVTQYLQTMVKHTEIKRRLDRAIDRYIGRSNVIRPS